MNNLSFYILTCDSACFYLASVDGFGLPPGHTHESLGLGDEEKEKK